MAEELNKKRYANIIEFLDAYVKNTQSDYDEFIEKNPDPKKYNEIYECNINAAT